MPGNVSNANPTSVMPFSLCTAFEANSTWYVRENTYANGESQRVDVPTTPRRSWSMSKVLTPTELGDLRDFFESMQGSLGVFYFYDLSQTSPKYTWDETGTASTGRFTVRFAEASWRQSINLGGRCSVSLTLVEVT